MPTPLEQTDPELLALARAGNRDAYGQLVSRHQTLVASLAYGICGDFARSEDIAQDAFVAAWRQLSCLDDGTKFKAWLCGITRNLAHNFVRHQGRRPDQTGEPLPADHEPPDNAPGPHEHAITREESLIVWQILENLPEDYREPLILFYREHQSIERVATALDLTEETVKQRLSRGRAMMRVHVEKLVERSLGFTTPGTIFTTTVLAALAAATPAVVGATAAANAAKGASIAKAAGSLSGFWLLASPLIWLAGLLFNGWDDLRIARSVTEKTFVKCYYTLLGASILGGLGAAWWVQSRATSPIWWQRFAEDPRPFSVKFLLWMWPLLFFLVSLVVVLIWGWRRYLDLLRYRRTLTLAGSRPASSGPLDSLSRWRWHLLFGSNTSGPARKITDRLIIIVLLVGVVALAYWIQ